MTEENQGNEEEGTIAGSLREAMAELEMTDEDLGFSDPTSDLEPQEDLKDQGDDESAEVEEESQDDESEVLVAPRSWSAEEKEAFRSFPAEAKRALLRRQADMDRDYHTRSQQIAEREKQIGDIEQHIAPLRDEMYREGVSPQVLAQMYKWHKYLSDPKTAANGIRELSTRYGVDPSSVQTSAASNSSDSALAPLESKIAELQQTITTQQQEWQSKQQQEYSSAVAAEVASFRSEVDDRGQKKFPLIGDGEALEAPVADELRIIQQMNPQMPLRQKLETAYKRALAMHPDIQQAIAAQNEQSSREVQAEKVRKAKLAGSSVAGSPSATPPTANPNRSLRDELLANWKQLSS